MRVPAHLAFPYLLLFLSLSCWLQELLLVSARCLLAHEPTVLLPRAWEGSVMPFLLLFLLWGLLTLSLPWCLKVSLLGNKKVCEGLEEGQWHLGFCVLEDAGQGRCQTGFCWEGGAPLLIISGWGLVGAQAAFLEIVVIQEEKLQWGAGANTYLICPSSPPLSVSYGPSAFEQMSSVPRAQGSWQTLGRSQALTCFERPVGRSSSTFFEQAHDRGCSSGHRTDSPPWPHADCCPHRSLKVSSHTPGGPETTRLGLSQRKLPQTCMPTGLSVGVTHPSHQAPRLWDTFTAGSSVRQWLESDNPDECSSHKLPVFFRVTWPELPEQTLCQNNRNGLLGSRTVRW